MTANVKKELSKRYKTMDVSKVKSTVDLINLYGEKDTSKDGKLKGFDEIPDKTVTLYDKNKDGSLSPWEVMQAANRIHARIIFSAAQIKSTKLLNRKGKTYSPLKLKTDTIIHGIKFAAGTWVTFHKNGQPKVGKLAADAIIHGIKYKGKTWVKFHNNGRVRFAKLAAITYIDGKPFMPTWIRLFKNGKVKKGIIVPPSQRTKVYMTFKKAGLIIKSTSKYSGKKQLWPNHVCSAGDFIEFINVTVKKYLQRNLRQGESIKLGVRYGNTVATRSLKVKLIGSGTKMLRRKSKIKRGITHLIKRKSKRMRRNLIRKKLPFTRCANDRIIEITKKGSILKGRFYQEHYDKIYEVYY